MLAPHRKTPNRSRELRERAWAKVEATLGGGRIICGRCRATLATYADRCDADIDHVCPGLKAIAAVQSAAERELGVA